jgi:hypothetical protein
MNGSFRTFIGSLIPQIITTQKVLPPEPIHCGVRISTYRSWRGHRYSFCSSKVEGEHCTSYGVLQIQLEQNRKLQERCLQDNIDRTPDERI